MLLKYVCVVERWINRVYTEQMLTMGQQREQAVSVECHHGLIASDALPPLMLPTVHSWCFFIVARTRHTINYSRTHCHCGITTIITKLFGLWRHLKHYPIGADCLCYLVLFQAMSQQLTLPRQVDAVAVWVPHLYNSVVSMYRRDISQLRPPLMQGAATLVCILSVQPCAVIAQKPLQRKPQAEARVSYSNLQRSSSTNRSPACTRATG